MIYLKALLVILMPFAVFIVIVNFQDSFRKLKKKKYSKLCYKHSLLLSKGKLALIDEDCERCKNERKRRKKARSKQA